MVDREAREARRIAVAATVEVSMASSLFMVLGYCLSGTRQSIVPLLRLKPKQPKQRKSQPKQKKMMHRHPKMPRQQSRLRLSQKKMAAKKS